MIREHQRVCAVFRHLDGKPETSGMIEVELPHPSSVLLQADGEPAVDHLAAPKQHAAFLEYLILPFHEIGERTVSSTRHDPFSVESLDDLRLVSNARKKCGLQCAV